MGFDRSDRGDRGDRFDSPSHEKIRAQEADLDYKTSSC